METTVQHEHFQDLVRNTTIFPLAKKIITENYIDAAPGHEAEMSRFMGRVFGELEDSAGLDRGEFVSRVNAIPTSIYKKDDPDFWFNRVYRAYKRTIKPAARFARLRRWTVGNRVLDFGCGDGRLSMIFSQNGYEVYMTDVLDYRDPLARDLPFTAMSESGAIPLPNAAADTAVVMAVLHHVALDDLTPLLDELRRVSKRVIVEEDTYGVPADFPGLPAVLEGDPYLDEFLRLSLEDQFRYLMFIDYFANALTQGLPQMNFPFNFRSMPEWIDVFQNHGFEVSDVAIMGFQKGFFNRSCHVWFVLDGIPPM